jgi:ribose transport system ATP-binding protein
MALVGENGAGKSTLMKILSGVHGDYDGEMRVRGVPVRAGTPREARDLGVATIYQELSNIGVLSVAENVFLGRPPMRLGAVDRGRCAGWRRRASRPRDRRRRHRTPRLPVRRLPAEVEIARVIHSGAQIVVLDEPTSALSPPEAARLFALMQRLRDSGTGMVFISHFLEDVLVICDRITVMRNSRVVATVSRAEATKHAVIEAMLGRESGELGRGYEGSVRLDSRELGEPVLAVEGLTRSGEFTEVSFDVRAGEIVGLYGYLGCGAGELARCLWGVTAPDSGTVRIAGVRRRAGSPADARDLGIGYVHDNRPRTLFLKQPSYKNVTLAHLKRFARGVLRRRQEVAESHSLMEQLHVSDTDPRRVVGTFSGGNQQKIALARWLVQRPKLLILNEPTKGIDVGAKAEVMEIIKTLRDDGVAILLLSAEPETVIAIADRVLVLSKGRISAEFADQSVTKDMVMQCA